MGAPDISIATDLASRAAILRDSEQELYESALRARTSVKIGAMRAAIVAGNEVTMRHAEAAMLEYLNGSHALRGLMRTALSQGPDVVGRELLRVVKDFMHADAEHDAERELKPAQRKPLSDSLNLGVKAALRIVADLTALANREHQMMLLMKRMNEDQPKY